MATLFRYCVYTLALVGVACVVGATVMLRETWVFFLRKPIIADEPV